MFLGANVSASGGLYKSLLNGDDLNINSIQTMLTAPMRWSTKDLDDAELEKFVETAKTSGVKKMLLHGIYLINLARKEKQMFHLSKLSLETHFRATAKLEKMLKDRVPDFEVLGLTFHAGSAIDLTPEEAMERIIYGLDWVMDKVEGGTLLLETSAGAGKVMGDTFEEISAMRSGAKHKDRIGYVVDTQHTFVSGYDWVNDLDGVVEKMDSILGLDLIKAIHLNDSMKPFDSHKDRHADLGKGEFGEEAVRKILHHPKLKNIPFILETPALKNFDSAVNEVEMLKKLAS